MKIPSQVKIGSMTYEVCQTEHLKLGCDYLGEISYSALKINLRPCAPARMEISFLHECVHGIMDFLGYSEHDEKRIDELASALHSFILDNPEIFRE